MTTTSLQLLLNRKKQLFCKMLATNLDDMTKQIDKLQDRHLHIVETTEYQNVLNHAFDTIVDSLENLNYLTDYFYNDTQVYIETMYRYQAKDCIVLSKEKQELLKELTYKLDDVMKVVYKVKELTN